MKFGIAFANAGPMSDPTLAAATGRCAEAAGFDSLWTVEHVLVPAGYESEYPYDSSGKMPGGEEFDIPDPLIWLAYVAAVTSTIKLGTGILIVPQRNPAVLAKEVATLDVLSGGRLLLGVGAGWLEEEFDALGVPFADRGRRLDSHIATMRALWAEEQATVDDEFTTFTNCVSLPKPAKRAVPIIIGGHSEPAARRAGRVGDGFFPGKGSHDELAHLLDVMRAAADKAGRDPDAIEITASGAGLFGPEPEREIEQLDALGVDRAIIAPLAYDVASAEDAYGAWADKVIKNSA